MATLRDIRRRISSVKSTQQVTRAMKMVSAAKLRRAQEQVLNARPYAFKMRDVLAHVASLINRESHPLLIKREPDNIGFVVVTADRGLCGSFNVNILKEAVRVYDEHTGTERVLITIGRKGRDFFVKNGYPVIGQYIEFYRELGFHNAFQIITQAIDLYRANRLDKLYLIYNEFKLPGQQLVVVENLLPLEPPDVSPVRSRAHIDYVYEPDVNSILDSLIPKHLAVQMWRVLLESNAAEHGARMTAMEAATDSAEEMIGELTLLYNRSRQEAITKEISDIVGGVEALA